MLHFPYQHWRAPSKLHPNARQRQISSHIQIGGVFQKGCVTCLLIKVIRTSRAWGRKGAILWAKVTFLPHSPSQHAAHFPTGASKLHVQSMLVVKCNYMMLQSLRLNRFQLARGGWLCLPGSAFRRVRPHCPSACLKQHYPKWKLHLPLYRICIPAFHSAFVD